MAGSTERNDRRYATIAGCNSAGASGYYQIIPSTWKLFGGTGPAAYLTSKAEQDAVASRIWRGGAGASMKRHV